MKQVVAAFLLLFAFSLAEYKTKKAADFLKSSELCFKKLEVPQSYASKFENFIYPDEPIVHDFVRCIWTDLEFFDDKNGFNDGQIAYSYKTEGDGEVPAAVISDCTRNKQNNPPAKWAYQTFNCLLATPIGVWFKEYINAAKV